LYTQIPIVEAPTQLYQCSANQNLMKKVKTLLAPKPSLITRFWCLKKEQPRGATVEAGSQEMNSGLGGGFKPFLFSPLPGK